MRGGAHVRPLPGRATPWRMLDYPWLPALRDGNKITAGLYGLEVRWGMQDGFFYDRSY